MLVGLAMAHNHDPQYAIDNLLLVPSFARVIYLLMPLYVICYVVIFYEAQRKKHINEIQEKSIKDMQNEKLISIGSMSAGMAHEINNPLMVLQGSVNLIESKINKLDLEHKEKEKFVKYTDNLKSGIDRITKIINSVRGLSSDGDKVELEEISVKEIIDNSLTLFKAKLSLNEVKIIIDDSLDDTKIMGTKIQLEQILMNFITNSIDEIKDKKKSWINISSKEDGKFCLVRVQDSGEFMDENVLKQLYDPFFTTKEVGKGTGLGLSLCKSLAEKNNGDIYYEHYKGFNSFVLKIPLA